MADTKNTAGKTPSKSTAKKTTPKKAAATTAAGKKDTSEKRTTKARKAAPLKAGATKAAANSNTTGDFKDRAMTKARSAATQGKERTGSAIENLSRMIEDSAKTIDNNVGEKYGNYARSAADAVSSFAEKLNAKDVDEMVEDARGFVRKSPAVAIGAAAVAGFLLSRLIKSGIDDNDA